MRLSVRLSNGVLNKYGRFRTLQAHSPFCEQNFRCKNTLYFVSPFLSIKGTAKRLSLRYLFVTSLTDKFDFWASVWYIEYLMIQQKERPNTDDYSQ